MSNPNPSPETRFKKGDPRIWKHGRPKSFDALREMALEIANERAMNGSEPVIINGHSATVSEAILRRWAQSKDPRLVQAFIAYAFGKVPDVVNGDNNGGPINLTINWGDNDGDNG